MPSVPLNISPSLSVSSDFSVLFVFVCMKPQRECVLPFEVRRNSETSLEFSQTRIFFGLCYNCHF